MAIETGAPDYAAKLLRYASNGPNVPLWPLIDLLNLAFEHDSTRFLGRLRTVIEDTSNDALSGYPNTTQDITKFRILTAWYRSRRRLNKDVRSIRALAADILDYDSSSCWLLAECLCSLGEQELALPIFCSALRDFEEARYLQSAKAKCELRKWIPPQRRWAHAILGIDAYHRGDMETARGFFEGDASVCFDDAPFLEILLARTLFKNDDRHLACDVYKRAFFRTQGNRTALLELCELHFGGEENPSKIASLCERFLRSSDDDIEVLKNPHAVYEKGIKDPNRPIKVLERLVKHAPELLGYSTG